MYQLKKETKVLRTNQDFKTDKSVVNDIKDDIEKDFKDMQLVVTNFIKEVKEKDVKLLRKNHLNGSSKIVDFLSIFPTDFAYFALSSTCHEQIPCPVVVRLNRIFRIDRMFEFFDKTETRTSFPNAFRISKIILNLLILIHWDACFYFVVSFYVGFETDVWVYHG